MLYSGAGGTKSRQFPPIKALRQRMTSCAEYIAGQLAAEIDTLFMLRQSAYDVFRRGVVLRMSSSGSRRDFMKQAALAVGGLSSGVSSFGTASGDDAKSLPPPSD